MREGQQSAQLRPLAISLVCGMAHSTQRTRAELWAHNGLELLLSLLQEQVGIQTSPKHFRTLLRWSQRLGAETLHLWQWLRWLR